MALRDKTDLRDRDNERRRVEHSYQEVRACLAALLVRQHELEAALDSNMRAIDAAQRNIMLAELDQVMSVVDKYRGVLSMFHRGDA